jgi:hypothetical protein
VVRWFVAGCAFGAALLTAVLVLHVDGAWVGAALPRFWLFDANPIVWAVCDVFARRELCIGLGFDGGPLEWAERGWMFTAAALMYGALALALRLAVRSCRRSALPKAS